MPFAFFTFFDGCNNKQKKTKQNKNGIKRQERKSKLFFAKVFEVVRIS